MIGGYFARQHTMGQLLRDRNYHIGEIYLALGLGDVSAHILRAGLALFDKDRVALLPVALHPHHRLEGGHVHAELLHAQTRGLLAELRKGSDRNKGI